MSGAQKRNIVVIGCGKLGAAATTYLEQRYGRWKDALHVLPLNHTATARAKAGEWFRGQMAAAWPDLAQALDRAGSAPLLCLVAAAEEQGGGSLLIAALKWLAQRHPTIEKALWLGLPPQSEQQSGLARACATLLELDQLQREEAFARAFLWERADAPEREAPVAADALMLHAWYVQQARQAQQPTYRSFGLAIDQATDAGLREAIARGVAQRWVSNRLSRADASPPLTVETLVASLDRMEADLNRKVPSKPNVLDPSDGGPQLVANVESALQTLKLQYSAVGSEYQSARAEAARICHSIEVALKPALGAAATEGLARASYNANIQAIDAFENKLNACCLQHEEALQAAKETVENSLTKCKALQGEDRVQESLTDPVRSDLSTLLNEYANALAAHAHQAVCHEQWQALKKNLTEPINMARSGLQNRLNEAGRLQQVLDRLAPTSLHLAEVPPPPHITPLRVTAEVVAHQVSQVVSSAKLENLNMKTTAESMLAQVTRDATAAVNRVLSRDFDTRPKVDLERLREAAKPRIRLNAPTAEVLVSYWETEATSMPISWLFADEQVCYGETAPFALRQLAALAPLSLAYRNEIAAKKREGLHLLPAPDGVWPLLADTALRPAAEAPSPLSDKAPPVPAPAPSSNSPAPEVALPQAAATEPAAVLLSAMLLGLLLPERDAPKWRAHYVAGDSPMFCEVRFSSLPAALQALREDAAFCGDLDRQVQRWREELSLQQRAALGALQVWLLKRLYAGAVEALGEGMKDALTPVLKREIEETRKFLKGQDSVYTALFDRMKEAVGTVRDTFSLRVERWRYLRW